MRVFFERSRGACIKIAAKAEAKCELSSLLFAIERCKDGFEVGASVEYLGNDRCYCNQCESEQDSRDKVIESPYERTRRAVYATGNRWAIENFNATH